MAGDTVDLGDVRAFMAPWGQDMAAMLAGSARIAGAAYKMRAEPFLQAGWQDACFQMGVRVANGLNLEAGMTPEMLTERLTQARIGLERHRFLASAVQEVRSGNGVKTLVMVRPAEDGRFLVAISFMGTVGMDDWLANIDIVNADGMHRGFQRRAMAFEGMERFIDFPRTAQQLGMRRLSLRRVVEMCRKPDSPFRLFVTGHSLGAAVMQIYVHRLLTDRGVQRELVKGCGFASPSVASGRAVKDPGEWPILHVLNTDDTVPRLGAVVHLGTLLRYQADKTLRETCYPVLKAKTIPLQAVVHPVLASLRTREDISAFVIGLMKAVEELPSMDLVPLMGKKVARSGILRSLVIAGDSHIDRLLRVIIRRAKAADRSMTGRDVPERRVAKLKLEIHEAMRQISLTSFIGELSREAMEAHTMLGEPGRPGVYEWLAGQPLDAFEAAAWQGGDAPVLRAIRSGGRKEKGL